MKQKNDKAHGRMPVLFIGHGSPMNIVANNSYTRFLRELTSQLPKPKSILIISAHWHKPDSLIQASSHPKIIYDFGGFPEELYQVQYPVQGNPLLAQQIQQTIKTIQTTESWGLDHGAWAILVHLFPHADIPVLQLSMKQSLTFHEHYELAQSLRFLREQGVLILASGNLVHNLYEINRDIDAPAYSWAQDFHQHICDAIIKKDFTRIDGFFNQPHSALFQKAHPSIEHYLPLAYALGALDVDDHAHLLFDEIQNGSISMLSFLFDSSPATDRSAGRG